MIPDGVLHKSDLADRGCNVAQGFLLRCVGVATAIGAYRHGLFTYATSHTLYCALDQPHSCLSPPYHSACEWVVLVTPPTYSVRSYWKLTVYCSSFLPACDLIMQCVWYTVRLYTAYIRYITIQRCTSQINLHR